MAAVLALPSCQKVTSGQRLNAIAFGEIQLVHRLNFQEEATHIVSIKLVEYTKDEDGDGYNNDIVEMII